MDLGLDESWTGQEISQPRTNRQRPQHSESVLSALQRTLGFSQTLNHTPLGRVGRAGGSSCVRTIHVRVCDLEVFRVFQGNASRIVSKSSFNP